MKLPIKELDYPQKEKRNELTEEEEIIYTDGSSSNNKIANSKVGAAWASDKRRGRLRLKAEHYIDNNTGEIMAVVEAIRTTKSSKITIRTDSKFTMRLLAGKALEDERNGYIYTRYKEEERSLLEAVRGHGGEIQVEWVKGHNGDINNELADKLAREAAKIQVGRTLKNKKSYPLYLRGMKLKTLTDYIRLYKREDPLDSTTVKEIKAVSLRDWKVLPRETDLLNPEGLSGHERSFLRLYLTDSLPWSRKRNWTEEENCSWCGGASSMMHLISCHELGIPSVITETIPIMLNLDLWKVIPAFKVLKEKLPFGGKESKSLRPILIKVMYRLYTWEMKNRYKDGEIHPKQVRNDIRNLLENKGD